VPSDDDVTALLQLLSERARMVVPTTRLTIVERDPTDNRVLEAAVAGSADFVVSGDADLLSLRPREGIAIVSPGAFLALLGPSSNP
jgi:putative PIN family toxin of toxin-antitoxin system